MQLTHGRQDFVLEAGLVGNHHAAGGVGIEMLPRELAGLRSGAEGGKSKSCNFRFRLSPKVLVFFAMRAAPRSAIRKITRSAPAINRFGNAINTAALTPPFCVGPNRIWPRGEIAEIKLMP
ncbi:MAG: hypothetical protein M3Z96_08790 [Pseudomonadota bacterium]|nr:hypothetical protein [Pseudomonadota bacterium]